MNPTAKRLLKELGPHKMTLVAIAVSGVIQSSAAGGIVMMIKLLFDALEKKDPVAITRTPVYVLAIALVLAFSRYFHNFLMAYTADKIVTKLRQDLHAKLMNLSLGFHARYPGGSGGLISRILNDTMILQNSLKMIGDFFREPVLLLILFGWLFWLNWKLTVFVFTIVPIILLFLKQIARSLRKYGAESQQLLERLTSIIKESLDGIRVIQSFCLEQRMIEKFRHETDIFLKARKMVNSRTEVASPTTEFLATIVILLIFTYLGYEIVAGRASFGDFASFLSALLSLQQPVKKIQESFIRIQETMVAATRMFALIDDQSLVPEKSPEKSKELEQKEQEQKEQRQQNQQNQQYQEQKFPLNWQSLKFESVGFSYGKEKILQDFTLEIKKGQVVALVGESGSGKSTVVNLLERFYEPLEGRILIDDKRISDFYLPELRKNIALVTQDVFLFNDTVAKNVEYGALMGSSMSVSEALSSANAKDFVEKMPNGSETIVGDRGGNLSGGEKQRISIARAIYKEAPILILDEATSALDSASEQEVQAGIESLMKGKTAIVIAHRLSTITKADKIVVLKSGKIVEVGTHQELVGKMGEYYRFFSLQSF